MTDLVLCDHPIDEAVLDGLVGLEEAVALHVGVELLLLLPRVLRVDAVDARARAIDLACVDLDVRGLALEAAEGWWTKGFASSAARGACLVPAVRSSEPIDIAMPKQIVVISGLMNCIVS